METPETLVPNNVAALRAQRRLSVRALSARLGELGRRILPSGITKLENQDRSADVGDLVALAVALGVNPSRLLLPDRAGDELVALTPTTQAAQWQAWAWADGRFPLAAGREEANAWEVLDDWALHARPADLRVREQHPAARAASRLQRRLDYLIRTQMDGSRAKDLTQAPGSARRLIAEEEPDELRRDLEALKVQIDALLGDLDGR